MMDIGKILTTILLFCMPFIVVGQDFMEDYEKMVKAYGEMGDFRIIAELSVYEEWTSEKPTETRKVEAMRKGENYLCISDNVIMLSNDECTLVVQPDRKLMLYSKRDSEETGDSMEIELDEGFLPDMGDIETLVKERISYIGKGRGEIHYRVNQSDGYTESIDLYIDSETYLVSRIETYYDAKAMVGSAKTILNYSLVDLSPTISAKMFSEKKYIRTENGIRIPTTAYRSYELVVND